VGERILVAFAGYAEEEEEEMCLYKAQNAVTQMK
jgi:hypothetical protein